MRRRSLVFTFFALFILTPAMVLGQTAACPALVDKALSALSQNCSDLSRNSACYGYNRVDATFTQAAADNTFSQPADRAQLKLLQSIETAPLDTNLDRWGVAVLNVQANVPNSLPGQAVTFMLLGDVKVENGVAPDEAFEPAAPITVTTISDANLRSAPSPSANVVGSLTANSDLQADGVSADGQWLRVLFADGPAWVNHQLIRTDADLSTLPVISKEKRSPMQAFYFTTGTGQPECNAAPPSALLVQGPEKVKVDITANGADITIGSTILLFLLPDGSMQLIVIAGEVHLQNIDVPAGFTVIGKLKEDPGHPGRFLIDGGWGGFRPLTPDELTELQGLSNIPADLLHYPIVIPTEADIQATLNALAHSHGSSQTNNPPGVCGNFMLTSPVQGVLPYSSSLTFYWNAAPGASGYRFHLYNDQGAPITEVETANTNITLDVTSNGIGGGTIFSWMVEALANNQVACTSTQVVLARQPDPNLGPPPAATQGPVCGDGICSQSEAMTCSCYQDCPRRCG